MSRRLFVGVPVPGQGLAALRAALEELGARPVPSGSWHVTLRFLGDADPGPVAHALDGALDDAVGCRGQVVGLGAFRSPGSARILWAGVQAPCLVDLARRVVDATAATGMPPEERDLHPHVTLARARRPVDASALVRRHQDTVFGAAAFDEVVMYASTPTSEGPVYAALRTWRLGTS